LRWRAARPTRSHGTPSAVRGLPGTGKELGAATSARLGQPDCGVALSLSLASRPRSASPSVRPRCWPWSPRANQPADRPGAVHHPQDRQHPHLKDPRQAGSRRSRGGSRDRSPARPRQAMIRVGPCRSFSAWQRMRLTRVRPARCHHLGSADPGSRDSGCSLGRVDVSTRSNALYDRCATEWGVPEVSPMASKRAGQRAMRLLKGSDSG
jgi:hypothetical protein